MLVAAADDVGVTLRPLFILACLAAIVAAMMIPACSRWLTSPARVSARGDGSGESDPKAPGRESARQTYQHNIDGWASWLMGVLILVGVAALIVSFTTLGVTLGISTMEAGIVLGLSALVPVLGYALSAWGVLAADVLTIGTLIVTVLIGLGWTVKRLRSWFPSWFRLRRMP